MRNRSTSAAELLPYDEAILEDTYREKPPNKFGKSALHASAMADAIANEGSAELRTLETVRAARADGISWEEIGNAFKITRQAAQQRWSRFILEVEE